ncbi:sigma-54-dependent Fis family transcriptional regulator [Sesbania bispinosa]|nr:sigma-54-dependent Fis family transcriptional regulator [Sesbania bispinosa]
MPYKIGNDFFNYDAYNDDADLLPTELQHMDANLIAHDSVSKNIVTMGGEKEENLGHSGPLVGGEVVGPSLRVVGLVDQLIAHDSDSKNTVSMGGKKEENLGHNGPLVGGKVVGPSLRFVVLVDQSKLELGKIQALTLIPLPADGETCTSPIPIGIYNGPINHLELTDSMQANQSPNSAMHNQVNLRHSAAEDARSDVISSDFDLLEDQLCEVPILEVVDLDVAGLSTTAAGHGGKLKRGRGRPRKKTLQKSKASQPVCSINNEFLSLDHNPISVANKVWEIRCALGLFGYNDETVMVNRLVQMERRDREAVGRVGN